MAGIFISYRRDDSAGHAGRLFDRLKEHFGVDRVFMDVEGIEPGTDFVEVLDKAVGSCDVLLAVMGKDWTDCKDAGGRRRLDDPNDFVRIETHTALRRGVKVVPVLVQDALMPQADALPPELQPLARRQGVELSDTRWDSDVRALIKTLEKSVAPAAARVEPVAGVVGVSSNKSKLIAGATVAVLIAAALGWYALRPKVPEIHADSGDSAHPPAATLPGTGAPTGQPQPVGLEFTNVAVAGESTLGYVVKNIDPQPLIVAKAELAGSDAAEFTLDASACLGKTLRQNEQCRLLVTFRPKTAGTKSAEVIVADNHPGSPWKIALTARALAPIKSARILTFQQRQDNRLCFGVADAVYAQITPDVGEVKTSAQECVEVAAKPGASYTLSARGEDGKTVSQELRISPYDTQALLVGSAKALDLGNVSIGRYRTNKVVATNRGTGLLRIHRAGVFGPAAEDFELIGDCKERELKPGESCALSVRFSPTEPGLRQASISFDYMSRQSPLIVKLSGQGASAAVAKPSVDTASKPSADSLAQSPQSAAATGAVTISPRALSFPAQEVCTRAARQIVTITNSTAEPVKIAGWRLEDTRNYKGVGCGGIVLEPGKQCVLSIVYDPKSVGSHDSQLMIKHSASVERNVVALSGEANAEGWCCFYGYLFPMNQASCRARNALFNADKSMIEQQCRKPTLQPYPHWTDPCAPPLKRARGGTEEVVPIPGHNLTLTRKEGIYFGPNGLPVCPTPPSLQPSRCYALPPELRAEYHN